MASVLSRARVQFEQASRDAFNKHERTKAKKAIVSVEAKQHEFDLYEEGIVAGGATTSPWLNRTGTNNTGGQDRVTAELLWLHLCASVKRKVLILKDPEMADGIYRRFGGADFFNPPIEIWLYNETAGAISRYKDL